MEVKTILKAYDLSNCRWDVKADGWTFEGNSGIDISKPENKKKAFKICIMRGVKAGRNEKATTQLGRSFVYDPYLVLNTSTGPCCGIVYMNNSPYWYGPSPVPPSR